MEKNIGKKLANGISYQIWYKRCLKGKFDGGIQICEGGGGSISARGFEPGGVQIRCDRENISIHLKYYQLSSEILEYKLILFRSGHFDHDMEKNITVIGMF